MIRFDKRQRYLFAHTGPWNCAIASLGGGGEYVVAGVGGCITAEIHLSYFPP